MAPYRLVELMESVATSHPDPTGLDQTLERLALTSRDTIPGTGYASFSLRHTDRHLESRAATDPAVLPLDELQFGFREGPGYEALIQVRTVCADDLATDPRWPTYGPAAARLGIRSQLAMCVHDERSAGIGLNLYSRHPHAFRHPEEAAGVLVNYARVTLANARDLNRLRAVVQARHDVFDAVDAAVVSFSDADRRADASSVARCAGRVDDEEQSSTLRVMQMG